MKFLFHHIPRTGGSSIVITFDKQERAFRAHPGLLKDGDIKDQIMVCHHSSYSEVRPHVNAAYKNITILRNPVDRVVSWCHFKSWYDNELGYALRTGLFWEANYYWHLETYNLMTRQLGGSITSYQPVTQDVFDTAKRRLEKMEWIGITETLNVDQVVLYKMAGIESPPIKTNMARAVAELSPETMDTIRDQTEWDRQLYEFALELKRDKE